MTNDEFKLLHSELIMHVQCIENDLRIIYAAMKPGDFDSNKDELERASLGRIRIQLKRLDYSDGRPDLSEEDYRSIDRIREVRNYWCHQCFLDYLYLANAYEREAKFAQIANRLRHDASVTGTLQKKIERIRLYKLAEYRTDPDVLQEVKSDEE